MKNEKSDVHCWFKLRAENGPDVGHFNYYFGRIWARFAPFVLDMSENATKLFWTRRSYPLHEDKAKTKKSTVIFLTFFLRFHVFLPPDERGNIWPYLGGLMIYQPFGRVRRATYVGENSVSTKKYVNALKINEKRGGHGYWSAQA